MNTPAHLIIGAAAFARPDSARVNIAAITGSFLPDASLYFMVFWNMQLLGRTPQQVFGHDYRDPFWQTVFAIDNSIPIYAALLALALWRRMDWLIAFAGAALIHVLLDLPLHHDDGRAHFFPFSDWVFVSPISYWDPQHYGGVVAPLEVLLCLVLGVVLWRRFHSLWPRIAIVAGVLAEFTPVIVFGLMFS